MAAASGHTSSTVGTTKGTKSTKIAASKLLVSFVLIVVSLVTHDEARGADQNLALELLEDFG